MSWLTTKKNKQNKPWLKKVGSEGEYNLYEWNQDLETRTTPSGFQLPDFFRNDCFAFAERLKLKDLSYEGTDPVVAVKGITPEEVEKEAIKETGDLPFEYDFRKKGRAYFGLDDNANFYMAKLSKRKRLIYKPKVGEIVIGARRPSDFFKKDDRCPYHAAMVIARDGANYITLEANAADTDLSAPVFDMYLDHRTKSRALRRTTKGRRQSLQRHVEGKTFKEKWKHLYQFQLFGE